MERDRRFSLRHAALAIGGLGGLYLTSRYNYILFHSIVEVFSIVVACTIFLIAWNARRFMDDGYFPLLGVAFLFVAGLDLLHLLAYKGMGVFPGGGANLPTQLWIAGRYLQSLSLLIAPLMLGRKPRFTPFFMGYAVTVSLLLGTIFYWKTFPVCYGEGTGLTAFKKVSEYAISLLLAASLVFLLKKRKLLDEGVLGLLAWSILFSIVSELAFTFYVDVYDLSNLFGHFCKIVAYYFIYKAIIETGFVQPYNLLFMHLKQNEDELLLANEELESRVRERTAELDKANAALRAEIAERSRAEKAHKESEELLRTVLDTLPVGVWVTDAKGAIIRGNPAGAQIWGGTRYVDKDHYSEYKAWWHGTGKSVDPDEWSVVRALTRGEAIIDEVFDIECFDGKRKTILNSAIPLRNLKQEIIGAVVVNQDITEQLRTEEENRNLQLQLLQAQKLDSLGKLAGGVAHDFNNLISAVLGFSELVLERLSPDQPEREYVQIIHDVGLKAAGLTRQLLAFSRKQVLEMKAVNLNAVVENMGKMLHRIIGEDIVLKFNPQLPLSNVLADPGQIEQILLNLAINARDAMLGGGRLLIETAEVELDADYARSREGVRPGPHVMLSVTDTGEGMSREIQERIFEPFFTTKEQGKGTGLGLATVYGIVKQHNGHIYVYSEPGMGTTFKIYLPAAGDNEGDEPHHVPGVSASGTETVLVADDEPYIRKLVMEALQPLGYRILEAANGEEALRVSDMHVGTIDLLLTDVIMPGMNGRQLAEMITARRPAMKVLFMSGYTDSYIAHHGVMDEGVAFVQKPLLPGLLAGKVRELLDGEGR